MILAESPKLAAFRTALDDWRAKSDEEQLAYFAAATPAPDRTPFLRRSGIGDRIRTGLFGVCLVQGGGETWQLALARLTDPARIDWRGCCVVGGCGHIDPEMRRQTEALMPVSEGVEAARSLARECDVIVYWAVEDMATILAPLPSRPLVVAVSHSPVESEWGVRVYSKATADRFVAVSELAMATFPEASRVGASVTWNAVDAPRIESSTMDRAVKRASWGVPDGARVAGFLGRLSAEKRPDLMARLAASLPEPWHVVCVGDGHEVTALLAMKAAGKLDRFHLVGPDPEAGDCLRAFDVGVVPSDYESFCLSMAEMTWLDLPIVSTDVGLARMVPGLSRPIPFDADGPTIARAVLAAQAEGPRAEAIAIRTRLDPARFGREWTDLLVGLVEEVEAQARPPGLDPAVRDRVLACPHRGPEGGLILMEEEKSCCGSGDERTACMAGKGVRPGRVTLRECLACQA